MTSWSGVAEAYRTSFGTLCAGTVEHLLDSTAARHHLDVGSGTGELARRAEARDRVVTAVDADADMVAMSAGQHTGPTIRAALPNLPLRSGTFDAVTANFVINHTDDPRAATRELARLLRPGGRLAATIWPAGPPAWASLVQDAFQVAGVVPLPTQRLAPHLDFERSVAGLTDLAESVGLTPIDAHELQWDWRISVDAFWAGLAGGVATAGQTLVAQPPDVRRDAEQAFRRTAAAEAGADHVLSLPSTAVHLLAS